MYIVIYRMENEYRNWFSLDQFYVSIMNALEIVISSHLSRVTYICVSELGHHWFRQWLVAYSTPRHYLNQWWHLVNWIIGNKVPCNFIFKIDFEIVASKTATIFLALSVLRRNYTFSSRQIKKQYHGLFTLQMRCIISFLDIVNPCIRTMVCWITIDIYSSSETRTFHTCGPFY